eukprot:1159705-Pelagomonas_calceolata.AAC.8
MLVSEADPFGLRFQDSFNLVVEEVIHVKQPVRRACHPVRLVPRTNPPTCFDNLAFINIMYCPVGQLLASLVTLCPWERGMDRATHPTACSELAKDGTWQTPPQKKGLLVSGKELADPLRVSPSTQGHLTLVPHYASQRVAP